MNQELKIEFVKALVESVESEILQNIELGKIPDNWDGIELRQYLTDKFAESAGYLKGKRKRDYNNTVLVNNL